MMANYTVKDTESGKTITFAWDGKEPPSEADLQEIFSEARSSSPAAPGPSLLDKVKGMMSDATLSDAIFPPSPSWEDTKAAAKEYGPKIADPLMKALPVGGAMLGGTLGTPAGPLGTVGGAALGGAAGASLEDVLRRITGIGTQPTTPGLNPLKMGAEMGTWEMGAPVLLNVLSKIGSPVAKALAESPAANKFNEFVTKNELPMSASTIQPSKMASTLESFVNLFPSGKYVTTKYQADLYKKFLDTRGQVLGELTGTGETMAGRSLQEGIKESKVALKEARDTAYGEIIPAAGGKGQVIELPQTRELIDNILESPRVLKNDRLHAALDKFNTESVHGLTADKLDKLQRQIWTLTKKDLPLGSDIWKALEADIKAFDETSGKALMEAINGAKGTAKDQMRYDFMSGIFNKSSTISRGEEIFQPDRFYSIVMNQNNQKYIKQQFGNDVLQNLQDYAEFARKVAMESSKRNLSDMSKLWQQTGMALGVGGTAASTALGGGIPGAAAIAVPYGTSYVMAHMIMKPRGVFKRWLTTGFGIPEGAKEALKIGGQAAIVEGNSND